MMGGQAGGYGMMGRQTGGYGMLGAETYGPMHDCMVDALAEALNLTPEEVQTRIDNGETPWQIAEAQGLNQDQIGQLMQDAHDQALEGAVEGGTPDPGTGGLDGPAHGVDVVRRLQWLWRLPRNGWCWQVRFKLVRREINYRKGVRKVKCNLADAFLLP